VSSPTSAAVQSKRATMKPAGKFSVSAVLAACCFLCSCGVAVRQAAHGYKGVRYSQLFETGRRGPLDPAETEWAKTAWKYFQNNTDGSSGLANGLDKKPLASVWNIADYLAALNAARALGIIKEAEFTDRVTRVVNFLNGMDLFDKKLPNRYYNVQSGAMVNAENAPQETGWSAMDLGRLLIWLRMATPYPCRASHCERNLFSNPGEDARIRTFRFLAGSVSNGRNSFSIVSSPEVAIN